MSTGKGRHQWRPLPQPHRAVDSGHHPRIVRAVRPDHPGVLVGRHLGQGPVWSTRSGYGRASSVTSLAHDALRAEVVQPGDTSPKAREAESVAAIAQYL